MYVYVYARARSYLIVLMVANHELFHLNKLLFDSLGFEDLEIPSSVSFDDLVEEDIVFVHESAKFIIWCSAARSKSTPG